MDAVHPLLNANTAPYNDLDGNTVAFQSGKLKIDATPLYLMGIILVSCAVLAGLKASGFKFVIGVGG